MARFRDTLSSAERRLHVQAWQLRQLVPEDVLPTHTPPPVSVRYVRDSSPPSSR